MQPRARRGIVEHEVRLGAPRRPAGRRSVRMAVAKLENPTISRLEAPGALSRTPHAAHANETCCVGKGGTSPGRVIQDGAHMAQCLELGWAHLRLFQQKESGVIGVYARLAVGDWVALGSENSRTREHRA